jgi:hypothetical protein
MITLVRRETSRERAFLRAVGVQRYLWRATLALGLLTMAACQPASGADSRRGRLEASLSLAGGVPVADRRNEVDYILLRQLDWFVREDLTAGFALGLGGAIDAIPSTALQLQSAFNFGTQSVVPYAGVHVGVLADFFDLSFIGTAGPLAGARWHIRDRWSLIAEAKYYATVNRLDDSFVAFVLGFSVAADPLPGEPDAGAPRP